MSQRNLFGAAVLATILSATSLSAQANGKTPPTGGTEGDPTTINNNVEGGKGYGGNGYGGNGYGGAGGAGGAGGKGGDAAAAAAAAAAARASANNSIHMEGDKFYNPVSITSANLGTLITQSKCQPGEGSSFTLNAFVAAFSNASQKIKPEGIPLDPSKFDMSKFNPLAQIKPLPGQQLTLEQVEANNQAAAAWAALTPEDQRVYHCVVRYDFQQEANRQNLKAIAAHSDNAQVTIATIKAAAYVEATSAIASSEPLNTAMKHFCNQGGVVEPKTGVINVETLAIKRRTNQSGELLPMKGSHEGCADRADQLIDNIKAKKTDWNKLLDNALKTETVETAAPAATPN